MEQMRHGPISNSQWHTLYSPSSMFAMEHFYFWPFWYMLLPECQYTYLSALSGALYITMRHFDMILSLEMLARFHRSCCLINKRWLTIPLRLMLWMMISNMDYLINLVLQVLRYRFWLLSIGVIKTPIPFPWCPRLTFLCAGFPSSLSTWSSCTDSELKILTSPNRGV